MKRFFRNLPIKHKLMALTVGISGIALLIACAAFAVNEQGAFRRTMARDFAILADMFDDNVAAGLAFNDTASIEQTLKTLGANQRILGACVYDKDGAVVASYRRAGTGREDEFDFPVQQPTGQRFGPGRLDTFQDVTLAGETIGVVYIGTDLAELRERAWRYAVIVGVLLIACTLVALLLVSRLQRIVSQPIVDLAQTVAAVTAEKNYAARAHKQTDDELGRLIDGFNEMLGQIQARDNALQAAHDSLEQRVVERTAELAQERELLAAILESVSDGILACNAAGVVTLSNGTLRDFHGLPLEPIPAARWPAYFDLHLPDGVTPMTFDQTPLYRALQGEVVRDAELVITPKDRPVRRVLASGQAFYDSKGAKTGAVVIVHDITARKLAETRLAETHRQLLDTSRRAGMAEIATGVLHNVGNVLNSVNVSATLVLDRVRNTKAAGIAKLSALLDQHHADLGGFLVNDPRGRMVPGYLKSVAESLTTEQQVTLTELEHLRKNIEHIKEIVAMQQTYARKAGVSEVVSVPDVVDEALRMNADALAQHNIIVVLDHQGSPAIATEKHKVMQILINLIRNAKHACDDSPNKEKRVVIRTWADKQTVRIAVTDNGIGIPAENLTRIFSHGFTTRKHGHGFGLHSGALAAKELGGAIVVHSDGPGRGASFTLELPLNVPQPEPAPAAS